MTLAVVEKTLPMATITGRTDRRTDRQTECDAICGPLLGRRAAKKALRETQTLRALAVVRFGHRPPAVTRPQTGPNPTDYKYTARSVIIIQVFCLTRNMF